ncbi:hypothetical protein DRF62_02130 [Chryseobacterium piscium]|uniref:DUF7352 domain-containing protein n=1 Tax=Chryseobacterium piscium TaxID=333702 RepID=A0A3D9BU08_9FLAO|nr:hypothetical protein [Chryseobacterium piscium]REC56978.1 hypothetical protein DRF62_02130 [Chryseobacterium piscium]
MNTIYKYELQTIEQQTISMPVGSEILKLDLQFGIPCIWVKVDTNSELGDRNFFTVGTGNYLHDGDLDFIGTYQLLDGNFVYHVFEINF